MNRTISHIPIGLMYALFAPFPWEARDWHELLALPEMGLWYLLLGAAAWATWLNRSRWRLFAPVLVLSLCILLVLTMAEGNVGTLFRHRTMLMPPVAILASPLGWAIFRRVRGARSPAGLA